MRTWNVLAAVAVVALLAGSSPGLINVMLVADQTVLVPGQTTTIHIWAQGTAAGLFSLGGSVVASGTPGELAANPDSFAWVPEFLSPPQYPPAAGTPGANGGWSGFGSMQADYYHPNANYGKTDYVELASYTITAQLASGAATLGFSGGSVSGFKPAETNKSVTLGTITPVTITIVPEPATMALLVLGSLLVTRRRSS